MCMSNTEGYESGSHDPIAKPSCTLCGFWLSTTQEISLGFYLSNLCLSSQSVVIQFRHQTQVHSKSSQKLWQAATNDIGHSSASSKLWVWMWESVNFPDWWNVGLELEMFSHRGGKVIDHSYQPTNWLTAHLLQKIKHGETLLTSMFCSGSHSSVSWHIQFSQLVKDEDQTHPKIVHSHGLTIKRNVDAVHVMLQAVYLEEILQSNNNWVIVTGCLVLLPYSKC